MKYKVLNVSFRPVFVEGVCLNNNESVLVDSISNEIRYLEKAKTLRILPIKDEDVKTTESLTEEGTGIKKKRGRSSSKILNE